VPLRIALITSMHSYVVARFAIVCLVVFCLTAQMVLLNLLRTDAIKQTDIPVCLNPWDLFLCRSTCAVSFAIDLIRCAFFFEV